MKTPSKVITTGLVEVKRYLDILEAIPTIKARLELGGEWKDIKDICEPLGLDDSCFRERPEIGDYLLNVKFWAKKGREAITDIQYLLIKELNLK